MKQQSYIPALAYRSLTGLYDPLVRITTRERRFKAALLQQARLRAGQQVLDLACGTATLTIAAKRMQPRADITGVDGDPDILARARVKAAKAEAELKFDESLSQHLPYADSSFDVVLSSLFFHHLDRENKLATLSEVWRVLKPGAELHIADWGKAANPLMRVLFLIVQMLDGFATTTDNVAGRLPELLRASGFKEVEETQRFSTVLGTLALYRAKR
jgi:ubiquinone/menaquinone biosynthesis C-methylase UbiE